MRFESRLEVVAEIRAQLVADFLRNRFAALLGDCRVMEFAELTNMQRCVTALAFVGTRKGKRQRRKRRTASPANKIVSHCRYPTNVAANRQCTRMIRADAAAMGYRAGTGAGE